MPKKAIKQKQKQRQSVVVNVNLARAKARARARAKSGGSTKGSGLTIPPPIYTSPIHNLPYPFTWPPTF